MLNPHPLPSPTAIYLFIHASCCIGGQELKIYHPFSAEVRDQHRGLLICSFFVHFWSVLCLHDSPDQGAYCPGDTNTNFTLCPRGTYQPLEGRSACLRCPVGFHCPDVGMPVPRVCPAGRVCDVTGMSLADQPCPEGHFCLEGTATTATTCGHPRCVPGTVRDYTLPIYYSIDCLSHFILSHIFTIRVVVPYTEILPPPVTFLRRCHQHHVYAFVKSKAF